MKKLLYGSTALVGASFAMTGAANAQGIELGVGGYMNNFFGFGEVDSDTAQPNSTGHFSDGEIVFEGEATLDNGISVGAQVQLESFSSGDQIDENYAWVQGSFGRLQLGSENTAAYLMQVGAPGAGVPINSGWITVFTAPPAGQTAAFRHPSVSTFGDFGNDENTATYFTPRLGGFQLGVSYQAALSGTGEGANFPATQDENSGEGTDGVSIGANFSQSFSGVDVALGGGYRTILDENPGAFGDSPEQYSAGLNVGFAGFTVGGSFLIENSDAPGGGDSPTDGHSFDAGASYATGPWTVAVTYLQSEVAGTSGVDDDEMWTAQGAIEYALGPGIATSFSVMHTDWEAGNGNQADGTLGIVGLALSF